MMRGGNFFTFGMKILNNFFFEINILFICQMLISKLSGFCHDYKQLVFVILYYKIEIYETQGVLSNDTKLSII